MSYIIEKFGKRFSESHGESILNEAEKTACEEMADKNGFEILLLTVARL